MTREDFFGAIEHNLQQLAAKGERAGACGGRVRGFRCITRGDSCCPPNVRCYDLLPDEPGSGASAVFRVFACFADESTDGGYRKSKFEIRKWYQESGRAAASEQPRAALVVGASTQWPEGMEPNAEDMPCGNVAFRMLAAPHQQPENGLRIIKSGDVQSYREVSYAMVPEMFDKVEKRVRDCVNSLLLPDGSVMGGGYLTVSKVMDELPMIPCDFVVKVFYKMQQEGRHCVEELPRAEGKETPEERIHIKLGSPEPSIVRKFVIPVVCFAVVAIVLIIWFCVFGR